MAAAMGIGHMSQNVYLMCAAEGLAAFAHTDFDGAALARAMPLPAGRQRRAGGGVLIAGNVRQPIVIGPERERAMGGAGGGPDLLLGMVMQ